MVGNGIRPNLGEWAIGAESYDTSFEGVDVIQDRLPPVEKGRHTFGDKFALADIAVAPFLGHKILIQLKNAIGESDKEEVKSKAPSSKGSAGI